MQMVIVCRHQYVIITQVLITLWMKTMTSPNVSTTWCINFLLLRNHCTDLIFYLYFTFLEYKYLIASKSTIFQLIFSFPMQQLGAKYLTLNRLVKRSPERQTTSMRWQVCWNYLKAQTTWVDSPVPNCKINGTLILIQCYTEYSVYCELMM